MAELTTLDRLVNYPDDALLAKSPEPGPPRFVGNHGDRALQEGGKVKRQSSERQAGVGVSLADLLIMGNGRQVLVAVDQSAIKLGDDGRRLQARQRLPELREIGIKPAQLLGIGHTFPHAGACSSSVAPGSDIGRDQCSRDAAWQVRPSQGPRLLRNPTSTSPLGSTWERPRREPG